jgi:aminocarboxymuconate-semialdehyde decarboxylase
MLLPRLRHAWRQVPPVRDAIAADPAEQARRLYVDDLVYDADTLRRLVQVFGADRVMAGSDYPFTIMDDDPAGSIAAPGFDAVTRRALRGANARRWLGLETP